MADEEKNDQSDIDDLVQQLADLNELPAEEPAGGEDASAPEEPRPPAPSESSDSADADGSASPEEVDALLAGAESPAAGADSDSPATEADIDALLAKAAQETPTAVEAVEKKITDASLQTFEMERFEAAGSGKTGGLSPLPSKIDLIKDVNLSVRVELGRRKMYIEDVLKLGPGSVVELEKLAGDPLDILVNNRLVARGEVLILNDNFCIRVTEIVKADGEAAGRAGEQ